MKELSLREIQLESYNILLQVKRICEHNNFQYFLTYGTLLGAIRHNGFIPWDDDLDIMMPRSDYERFIQFCIDHHDDLLPYELKHYRTCGQYIYPIARLSNSNFYAQYENAKDYGLGCFVDIYPLDGINVNDVKYIKRLNKLRRKISIIGLNHYVKSKYLLKNIVKFPYYCLTRRFNIKKQLQKIDILARKYSYDESEQVGCVAWELDRYPKKILNSVILHKFEDDSFPIPVGYHDMLEIMYGNYMELPPKSQQVGHHYYRIFKK